MQTVILTTCDNASQAHLLQGALANEGIRAVLHNEITASTLPNLSGMMGMGITVVVLKEDYDRARQVLANTLPSAAGELCCPYCGSTDICASLGRRRGLKAFISLLSLLVWTPMGNIKTAYRCRRCGEDFGTPSSTPDPAACRPAPADRTDPESRANQPNRADQPNRTDQAGDRSVPEQSSTEETTPERATSEGNSPRH